jgi:hypothetical protein
MYAVGFGNIDFTFVGVNNQVGFETRIFNLFSNCLWN